MEAVFALADRITVLVYGRVIATGAPADIRANAAVRDAYLGEAEAEGARPWLTTCSNVAGIETCYGLSQVLFGVSLSIAPGEMVTLMGRNGMGKTTTVRSIIGLTPARAGDDPLCRPRDPRPAVLQGRQARHRPGAGRPADFPEPERARESGGDGGRARRRRLDAGQGLRAVPAAGRARRQHGQPAFRRRAADAGDRPRADDQSAPADPGRGDRRPGAADPRRDLALPRQPQANWASPSW